MTKLFAQNIQIYRQIYRQFSRSVQLGGLWSALDQRSHQGIRQSKLCYPIRITRLVKERTLVRRSLTLFSKSVLVVGKNMRLCLYMMSQADIQADIRFKAALLVLYFFGFSVVWSFLFIYSFIWFSIYSVLWIRSSGPARNLFFNLFY